jgi:hypothetical protein
VATAFSFEHTPLWKSTLAQREHDEFANARTLLRNSFLNIRARVAALVGHIHSDFRDYTVHDITHLDALWEIASNLIGTNYQINPAEAFVLGCSFLFHDAGMTLAAYPNGIQELRNHPYWDSVFHHTRNSNTTDREQTATLNMVRLLHADRAEKLPHLTWTTPDGASYQLISDPDIVLKFGEAIGRVSASHWWSHDRVSTAFSVVKAAPSAFPSSWRLDLLKVACILRIADAAHLDERRAPGFLWALRRPNDTSSLHWKFQNRLAQPDPRGDALHFSSTKTFGIDDANAWWQAYDAVQMVDDELRRTDVVLADIRGDDARFAVRRVANAESARSLSRDIEASGWLPLDTSLKVASIPDLVKKLGGRALYGDDDFVPVRELIQNAIDAILIRRAIVADTDTSYEGKIHIILKTDGSQRTLSVSDNGIGMGETTIIDNLLSLGSSGWLDDRITSIFPDAALHDLDIIGKFGIGFFSVFMISDEAIVSTRRFDSSLEDGLVLQFGEGVSHRPILRASERRETIVPGGTKVTLRLRNDVDVGPWGVHLGNLSGRFLKNIETQFAVSPVDIFAEVEGEHLEIKGCNWKNLSNEQIRRRLYADEKESATVASFIPNLRSVFWDRSKIGQLALFRTSDRYRDYEEPTASIVCAGVCVASIRGMIGVIEGRIARTARDQATVEIPEEVLANWATEQAGLISALQLGHNDELIAASQIRGLGGNVGNLLIVECADGFLDYSSLRKYVSGRTEIFIVQDAAVSNKIRESRGILIDGVISVSTGVPFFTSIGPAMGRDGPLGRHRQPNLAFRFYIENENTLKRRSLVGLVLDALIMEWDLVENDIYSYYYSITDGEHTHREMLDCLKHPTGEMLQLRGIRFTRSKTEGC